MKTKIIYITLFLFSLISYSQNTIEAKDIMKDLKAGKDISYQNKTIVGTLDFTFMEDALESLPKKKKRNSWWGNGNIDNKVDNLVEVAISFTNCTFRDDVLAYIPDEDSGYTFTADFEKDAIFKNCNFERKAMFKYSKFERDADFSGSTFDDDTTFKYAKFNRAVSFTKTKFAESATFKYAEFERNVSFSEAIFEDSAVFKYTKFYDGVSFKKTYFEEDLNIKYMKVTGDFNISGMQVAYDIDSKYTKINGKDFNKYLLSNRE